MLAAFSAFSSLFLVAFVAATVFPMQSEAVLVGLVMTSKFSTVGLIAVASVGNTFGSVVNWFLGRAIERFHDRRWFPVNEKALERATGWYRKYGRWSLLLSWMPIFGDALTVVAGVLREPLLTFTILVFIAKTGRYVLLVLAVSQFAG
jgi:membrane protein YqaA with SNARE-associated domain